MSRRRTRGRVSTRSLLAARKITKVMLTLKLFAMGYARKMAMETNCATKDLPCADDGTSFSPLESSDWKLKRMDSGKGSPFESIFSHLPVEGATENSSSPQDQDFQDVTKSELNRQSLDTFIADIAKDDDNKPLDSSFTCSSKIFSEESSKIGVLFEPKSISSFEADFEFKCKTENEEKCIKCFCQVPSCIIAQRTLSKEDIEHYFKNVPLCSYQPTVKLHVLTEEVLRRNIVPKSLKGEEPLGTENGIINEITCDDGVPALTLRPRGSAPPQVSSDDGSILHLQTVSISAASQQSVLNSDLGVGVEQRQDSSSCVGLNSFPICSQREDLEERDCAANMDAADVLLSTDTAVGPVLQEESATGLEKDKSHEVSPNSPEQTMPNEALQVKVAPSSECASSSSPAEMRRVSPEEEHCVDPAPPAPRCASLRPRKRPLPNSADEPVRKHPSNVLSVRPMSSPPRQIASGGEQPDGFSAKNDLGLPERLRQRLRRNLNLANGTSKARVRSRPQEHLKLSGGRINPTAGPVSSSAESVQPSPSVPVRAQKRPTNPRRKRRLLTVTKKRSNSSRGVRTEMNLSTTVPAAHSSDTKHESSEESPLPSACGPGSFEDSPSSLAFGPLEECGPFSLHKVVEEGSSTAVNEPLVGVSAEASRFSEEEAGSYTTGKLYKNPKVGGDHLDRRDEGSDEEDCSCVWCGKVCSSRGELDMHSVSHAEPSDDCSVYFCSEGTLVAEETPGPSNVAECGGAVSEKQVPFGDAAGLSLSALKSSVSSTEEMVFPHHSSETVIVGTGRSAFQCFDCSLTFPTASGRRAHMVTEHAQEVSIACRLCGYVSGSELRYEHHCAVSHSMFRFKCPSCNDLFMSAELLTFHRFSQHTDKDCRFFCPVCSVASLSPTFVTHHIRTEHRGSFPYSCWCGQVFDNLVSFEAHAAAHAEELFKLHCDVCFLWCPTRELLNAHVANKHSQASPYCCPLCSDRHSSLVRLSRHVRERHPDSEAYVCDSCGARFTSPLLFWNHIITKGHMVERVAYLYKCRECTVISFDRLKIAEHEEIEHTGILPLERATKLFSLLKEVSG